MRNLSFIFIALLLLVVGCTKTTTTTTNFCTTINNSFPVNNSGLITDTAGTNDSASLFIPNAFTPDNDGVNDVFYPFGKNISSIQSMIIFDHSGDTVIQFSNFSPNDPGKGWDGKSVLKDAPAKYYYKIQAATLNGNHIGIYGDVYLLTCTPNCLKTDTLRFATQYNGNGFDANLPNGEQLPACP
jgi:gliding motility-associated-like protein